LLTVSLQEQVRRTTAATFVPGRLARRTVHRAAWEFKPRRALEDDVWELYDARTDFSLSNDLAAKNPQKLKEMQDLFMTEAVKYSVLPLDDRTLER
jgi:arylsulfatase A-like enzyme